MLVARSFAGFIYATERWILQVKRSNDRLIKPQMLSNKKIYGLKHIEKNISKKGIKKLTLAKLYI